MIPDFETIDRYLAEHRQEMLEFWKRLVNMQGYSKETDRVNRVMHFLRDTFDREGLSCRLVDTQGNADVLVAVDGEGRPGRPVLLSGHVDTVFPEGSFPKDPFTIRDGIAYGPGVVDMKGGVVMMLYIVKALRNLGFQDRPVKIVLCGDEEILHAGAITPEILQAEAQGALCAFNMETGRTDNCLTVGRKGGMDCHVTTHGVASHVGNDFLRGRNAIEEMARKIIPLQALTEYDKGVVVSVNVIRGGTVSNAIPDSCTAELDIRYNKLSDGPVIRKKIEEVCSKTYIEGTWTELDFVSSIPAFEDRAENRNLLAFVNRVAETCGIEPMGAAFVGGNSDASYLALAGVPTVCSCGVKGRFAHTNQEQGDVETLFQRTKLFTAAICALDSFQS